MVDTCSLPALVSGAKCFDCFSATEKDALLVYLKAQTLIGMGGTDYSSVTDLQTLVACLKCLPDFRLQSLEVQIYLTAALDAGYRGETDIASLRAAIKCLSCLDRHTLRAMQVALDCRIEQRVIAPIA